MKICPIDPPRSLLRGQRRWSRLANLFVAALCPATVALASANTPQATALGKPSSAGVAVAAPAAQRSQPTDARIQGSTQTSDALVEIELHVGESRVLAAPGVARIAVGNAQVLTASALDQREVLVFANAPGVSTLFVWSRQGQVKRYKLSVTGSDMARLAKEVQAFLGPIQGLRVAPVGDKVVVEGDGLSDTDLLRVEQLAQRYPQLLNFTHRQGWEQMVMLDVKVVEFPVNDLRELGLKWMANGGAAVGGIWSPVGRVANGNYTLPQLTPGAASAADGPALLAAGSNNPAAVSSGRASAGLGFNLGLGATLQAMAQSGRTTVLAEPQLSARNGAKASFLAGGEIPFAVSSQNGTTVQFKPYGVKLDIQPRVDRLGNVRATIETEFSQIDLSLRSGESSGVPGLLVRRTSTEFNVRAGETIVLSGLIQREVSNTVDKVPGLGDMPVLGSLFRSKRFQNKETELVVFVTPTVVDPRTPALVEKLNQTHQKLADRMQRTPATDGLPRNPGNPSGSSPSSRPDASIGESP